MEKLSLILTMKKKQLKTQRHLFEYLYDSLKASDQLADIFPHGQSQFSNIDTNNLKTVTIVDDYLTKRLSHG